MPDELTPFPVAKAILTIPFWLREAPGPLSVENRQRLLEKAAKKLNGSVYPGVPRIDWKVLELAWCREPHRVGPNHQPEVEKIWHPKPAVSRKGWILTGFFLDDELQSIDKELSSILSPQDEVHLKVQECSISYFDYGICALEFEFGFTRVGSSDDLKWLASSFWGDFKKKIMDAVEGRNLGVLKKERWDNVQNALVGALDDASVGLPRPIRMVPFDQIFGAPNDSPAHVCASFGINFILFGDLRGQTPKEALAALDTTVKTIIGRPISQPDGPARSEDLAYVFYGAVHTLVIIQRPPETKEAAGAVDAARVMLRYLWMGYGVLAEAPRGLMALQGDYYLGYFDHRKGLFSRRRHPKEKSIRRDVINLDRAGQTLDLLIAEFHFSMFWESEIEYDIYHSAFEQWRMKELAEFAKDTLSAATKTAEVLRRRIDVRRQFRISLTLGALTSLTIVSVFVNIFSLDKWNLETFEMPYLSRWESEKFSYPLHPLINLRDNFGDILRNIWNSILTGNIWDSALTHIMNIWDSILTHIIYYPVTAVVLSFCLIVFFVIFWVNMERVAREPRARRPISPARPSRRRIINVGFLTNRS